MQAAAGGGNWTTPTGGPSVKWRGHSLTELRAGQDELAQAAAAAQVAERAKAAALAKIAAQVAALLEVDAEHLVLNWWWSCPESPTRHCAYDTAADPSRDSCLVCGEPEERR